MPATIFTRSACERVILKVKIDDKRPAVLGRNVQVTGQTSPGYENVPHSWFARVWHSSD